MFDLKLGAIPRTTTREEWRALHRWKRLVGSVVERNIESADFLSMFRDLVTYGNGVVEMKEPRPAHSGARLDHLPFCRFRQSQ